MRQRAHWWMFQPYLLQRPCYPDDENGRISAQNQLTAIHLDVHTLDQLAGCIPAGLSGDQRVTTQAITYIVSLLVSERVAGKSLSFLVDIGCTHNILPERCLTAWQLRHANRACHEHVTKCLSHVRQLLEETCKICKTDDRFAKLATLLTAYQNVFSKGDNDVGQTNMGEHSILLLHGTRPIRQPPRQLELKKDQEWNAKRPI